MEKVVLLWHWFVENAHLIAIVLGSILVAAEAFVALTPTKSDDLFLARIEKPIKKLIAFLNRKKGGGVHPAPKDPESNV